MRITVVMPERVSNPDVGKEGQTAKVWQNRTFEFEAASQLVLHEASGQHQLVGEILPLLRDLAHIWGTLDHCRTSVWEPGVRAVIYVSVDAPRSEDNCSPIHSMEALQLRYPVLSDDDRKQLTAA